MSRVKEIRESADVKLTKLGARAAPLIVETERKLKLQVRMLLEM